MGPPPDGDGEAQAFEQLTAYRALQWGRRLMATERSARATWAQRGSTLQWGRRLMATERVSVPGVPSAGITGFNGAAA